MLQAIRNTLFPFRTMPSDLSDCLVIRDPDRPWLLEIVEPLQTDAPATASPLCCYRKTVIFYEYPTRIAPESGAFARHDEIETKLVWFDVILFEDELFDCQGGRVIWDGSRWIMTSNASRCDPRRLQQETEHASDRPKFQPERQQGDQGNQAVREFTGSGD